MKISSPEIAGEVTTAFYHYEKALMADDIAAFRRGRQSQAWVEFEDGWKFVSAHVSIEGNQS